tara:strand:+ start:520 stop:933 length:414 start_codon:yes stop_codon:yes gene_type:complete
VANIKDILLNSIRLKSSVKTWTIDELEDALAKLTRIVENRRAEISQSIEERNRKREHLAALLQQAEAAGVDVKKLLNKEEISTRNESQGGTYAINVGGRIRTWNRKGKPPAYIQKLLDDGVDIEQFRVDKKNEKNEA